MKISDLIKTLQKIQKKRGDVPVFLSSDSEGNSYGTIEPGSINHHKGKVILYPWSEHMDISELPGE